jgi:Flp pilus assembly protein TadB
VPVSERDWWKDKAALLYEADEFEEPARPGVGWTLWQLAVLAFLAIMFLAVVSATLGWVVAGAALAAAVVVAVRRLSGSGHARC